MAKKRKKPKLDRLEKICVEIADYNKNHDTNYSYGEYTALVRMGRITSRAMLGSSAPGGKSRRRRQTMRERAAAKAQKT